MWVYTEYGQKIAERHGSKSRIAGQPAFCGKSPVTGRTAEAWEKSGYIEWKETENDHGLDNSTGVAAEVR